MIAINSNSFCQQARKYYYEYLSSQSEEGVPGKILDHIDECQHCQAEVGRLKDELDAMLHAQDTENADSAITTGLELHFAYIGTSVTCQTVRPFLPSLADPILEIGIPTPITAHLDKCQQCTNDLETIQQLNLTHKQLCRLGQLFAEKPAEDAVSCSQAQVALRMVATMNFHKTNAEVLKHLCICPDCRELLYQYREGVHRQWPDSQSSQKQFPCKEVSASDIFDYCFPYGIDPADDQYAKFRSSLTAHVRQCPRCLGKMQQLHRAVYSILERRESGIVTCFKVKDDAHHLAANGSDDLYRDWPIKIEVFDETGPVVTVLTEPVEVPPKHEQRVSALNSKQFIKPAAVAAAVILAVVILFNGPVAKAVDLSQIYKALEQIKNVYLAAFASEKSESAQELWISRTLDVKMFKTKSQLVLWNTRDKSRKAKDSNTGAITKTELNDDTLAKVGETMEVPWGLLPFENISAVPEDAEWQNVTDKNIDTSIPNAKVYDLMWVEKKFGGSMNYHKWRGYIDTETKLPARVERWEKHTNEEEYKLLAIIKVAYPDAVEIQSVIDDAGF